jgi:hypothetical protein
MRNDPEILFIKGLKKAAPILLDAALDALNSLGAFPRKIPSSWEGYLRACIDHAVAGDHKSIEDLWRVQPPETNEAIIFLSPSTGETLRIPASLKEIGWFRTFVRFLGWIATVPEVGEKVGRCAQCDRLYRFIRKNQRNCGKTCPRKGTRMRTEYHRTFQEFNRRVKSGKVNPKSILKIMRQDPRYKEQIEKYGEKWLNKTREG